jgi:hypothetical protein
MDGFINIIIEPSHKNLYNTKITSTFPLSTGEGWTAKQDGVRVYDHFHTRLVKILLMVQSITISFKFLIFFSIIIKNG